MSAAAAVPRIAPLEPPYDPETEAQLARWMPPGAAVEPLALFRTLARHEPLMARMRPLGAYILGSHSSLPLRVREIVIDRTCALAGAEYEWGVHAAAFADAAGLDAEQIASTARGGHGDPCWDAEGAAAMRLAEELHETSKISDSLWEELSALFEERQIVELVVTAGWYHVISYVCNALGVPLEEWALRFPS
ncbi:MAG TPA: carboxymuconolactone decarboxylase family protein [Solirubrobacteraceae bacterium]|nr:carboxymuconolactone decarboxylase family protein [Solirubrobacteraceae bacterium]